jgi:integrase/recombinase XerD
MAWTGGPTAADLRKKGVCHLFRRTCATAMLENGADVRFLQAMLGHVKHETTAKLKEIHTMSPLTVNALHNALSHQIKRSEATPLSASLFLFLNQ